VSEGWFARPDVAERERAWRSRSQDSLRDLKGELNQLRKKRFHPKSAI
jgi:hypothetical protein